MNKILSSSFGVLAIAVVLTACSEDERQKTKSHSPFDPQLQALEKAKQVDKLIQDADAKRRKEMEDRGL
ncbi:MAG: hypothetical protein ACU837_07050 [Gammaproteobacteria bacterium]